MLTDGTIYFCDRGEEIKAFNILDGLGLKMLRPAASNPPSCRAANSKVVALRAKELGIRHVLLGVDDKRAEFQRLFARLKLAPEKASHMGDDLPDLPVMRRCGIALAPPNAHAVILGARASRHPRVGRSRCGARSLRMAARARRESWKTCWRSTCVNDRLSRAMPLLILLALATLTFWLDQKVQQPPDNGDPALRHDPDFVVEGFLHPDESRRHPPLYAVGERR